MFGYATNETPEYMPVAISLAHKLVQRLSRARKSGLLSYLRPDGKSQVTVEYDENGKPVRVDAVVIFDAARRNCHQRRASGRHSEARHPGDHSGQPARRRYKYHINPTAVSSSAVRWATPA